MAKQNSKLSELRTLTSTNVSQGGDGSISWLKPPKLFELSELRKTLFPKYESRAYGPIAFSIIWDPQIAHSIRDISERRSANRINNYILLPEIPRVERKLKTKREASIRFGVSKPGHGYSGERGDFCLIAGVVRPKQLTLYYRSLELIGGLAYDLTLVRYLEESLGCCFRQVDFVTAKAFVFALKGNSNEKLYPKLKVIYG